MKWRDNFIICMIVQSVFCISNMYSEKNSVNYTVYATEVLNTFISEMESEFNFSCMGSGGGMPYNVRSLTVMFSSNEKVDIVKARYLGVTSVHKLLYLVNNHEQIRPYLNRYPFTANDINISISFYDRKGKRNLRRDGLGAIRLLSGTVFYEVAEMQKVHDPGLICGKTGKFLRAPRETKEIGFKEVLRETYEEAEAIVEREKQANL